MINNTKAPESNLRQRTSMTCSLLVIAILATFIYIVSAYVIWLGDDADYAFYISDSIWNSYGSIDSIGELFCSQGNHYMHVNGRYVAHFLVQLFNGMLGQTAFAVCNAIVYPFFIWLLMRMAMRKPLRHAITLIATVAIVLLTFVTKMMPSTQIGFIWMFALSLLWLKLLLQRKKRAWWAWCLILPLGIIAGNGQEALTTGISAALGFWCISRHFKIGKGRMIAICGYWLGTLSLCLAPSMLMRVDTVRATFGESILYTLLSLRAFYILVAVALYLCLKKKTSLKKIYSRNALWLNALIVLIIFNLTVGVYCNRQLFGIELCSIIVTLRILPRHRITWPWTLLFTGLVVIMTIPQISGIKNIRKQYHDIERMAIASDNGNVFYDRTHGSENVFYREYRYYEEIVGQNWADPHHSLSKKLKYKYPNSHYLFVIPTCLKSPTIFSTSDDTVINYAPGHYVAIVDKTDTTRKAQALVDREFALPPFTHSTDTLDLLRKVYTGVKKDAYIVVSDQPFRKTVGVRVIP